MEKYVPKEMVSEDGHVYELKRPLHRQGWFWVSIVSWILSLLLLVLLVGFFILSNVLASNSNNLNNLLDGNTSYFQQAADYEEYSVGEAATLDNGGKMTVVSVQADDKQKLEDDATGHAIVVKVKVDNKTNKNLTVNPYFFGLYDEQGDVYILDTSTFDQDGWTQKIAPGTSAELTLIFDGEDGKQSQLNVVYNDEIRWWQERGTSDSSED